MITAALDIRRHRVLCALALGGVLAASASACAAGGTNPPPAGSTAASSASSTATPSGISVTAAQSAQLCSDLSAQLQNWRTQTPSIGRGGLNIVVQTWAARSGVINAQVIQDRALIDRITMQACPDVRAGAISALEIPDLASGLVGF